jgi:hypothetical protein
MWNGWYSSPKFVKILRLFVGQKFSIGILLMLVAKIDEPPADVSVERTQDVEDAGKIVRSGPRRCKLRFCVDDSVQWFYSMQVIGQNFAIYKYFDEIIAWTKKFYFAKNVRIPFEN